MHQRQIKATVKLSGAMRSKRNKRRGEKLTGTPARHKTVAAGLEDDEIVPSDLVGDDDPEWPKCAEHNNNTKTLSINISNNYRRIPFKFRAWEQRR